MWTRCGITVSEDNASNKVHENFQNDNQTHKNYIQCWSPAKSQSLQCSDDRQMVKGDIYGRCVTPKSKFNLLVLVNEIGMTSTSRFDWLDWCMADEFWSLILKCQKKKKRWRDLFNVFFFEHLFLGDCLVVLILVLAISVMGEVRPTSNGTKCLVGLASQFAIGCYLSCWSDFC